MSIVEDCEYGDIEVNKYRLFGFIPLFETRKNQRYEWISIFGIPLLKLKHQPDKDIYRLFAILPVLTVKKRRKYPYAKLTKRYNTILESLRLKYKKGHKIDIGFQVIFDSVFPAKPLFEKMLNDDMFNPSIIVIPDISRGEENMYEQMDKTYKTLSAKYPNVYKSWDEDEKTFKDFSKNLDIVCSANPYEPMTHKLYRINKLAKKNLLSIYFNYGYPAVSFARRVASLGSLSKMWKVFSESDAIMDEFKKYMKNHGESLVLAGYMKLDELAEQKIIPHERKIVILAPHHTIEDKYEKTIGLSNFLKYAELFKELPKLYPQIDFIFRPHPLLKVTLAKETVWGKEKTEKYFEEIQQSPNLIFQDGGDYFETFANSDGIIHDCSSFLAEYMFTEKPVCYMLRNREAVDKYFMDNGKRIISHCYQAYKKEDIIKYLDNVILNGNDTMAKDRIEFVNSELKVNYPNVSEFVLNYLKNTINTQEGSDIE